MIIPFTKNYNKTFVDEFPDTGWYRLAIPRGGEYEFYYEAVRESFKRNFGAELKTPMDIDVFYIDDFTAEKYSSDETYVSDKTATAF